MDVHVYIGVTALEHGIAFYTQAWDSACAVACALIGSSLKELLSLSSCWYQTDHKTLQGHGPCISTSSPPTSMPLSSKRRMPVRCWIALCKSGSGGEWPI
jgi:hypothetical protein